MLFVYLLNVPFLSGVDLFIFYIEKKLAFLPSLSVGMCSADSVVYSGKLRVLIG